MNSVKIPLARYQFSFKMTSALRQPDYAGSMLRGCFGHALKRITCITKQQHCQSCLMFQNCTYPAIFETPPRAHKIQQFANVSNPYLIEPPPWGSRIVQPEELFQFSMVLTGTALEQLSLLILVWQQVFQYGLGKEKACGELMAVELVKADGTKQLIYPQDSEKIQPHDQTYSFKKELKDTKQEEVVIKLQTILRLQKHSKGVGPDKLKARDFLVTLLRRINLINEFHNNIILINDFQYYNQLAESTRLIKSLTQPLKWQNWTRYSNRQQQKMLLGGVIGEFTLEGELEEFMPFLELGEYLHVGKNTVFGLGQYSFCRKSLINLS